VRRALTMAIDYKTIVAQLYGGDGEYPGFPTLNIPDFQSVYFPLSEASPTAQDMYTYNPDKAKQMLAAAGYPNGFSATITCDATGGIHSDQLALIKDYWSKIGVNLTIQPMEFAAYTASANAVNYDQMMYYTSGSHGIYIRMINWLGGTIYNGTFTSDPKAVAANNTMQAAMATGDQATADATYKQFESYAMDQQWTIPFPAQDNYTVWWPWLQNYHGELNVGFDNGFKWTQWVWLDQDMKKSMGY
jgi:peptide/nickel transport system substrate-binding protein